MKQKYLYIFWAISVMVFLGGIVNAATILFPNGGGTGWGLPGGLKAHSVIIGNGLNPVSTTTTGTTGQVLTSNGASADPTFQTILTSAFPFTPTTNFNVNTNATGTPIWFQGSPYSIFASSTAQFVFASSTLVSATGNLYANISGAKITLGGLPGAESSFGGLWLAQNSPGSTNYLLLGSATQSFINAPSLDIESRIANVSRFQVGPNGVSINGMDNTAPPFPLQVSNQEKTAVLATMLNNGFFGLNTTTPVYNLTIASTTGPQLALSAGAGVGQWIFRNAGGNLYIASTTIDGLATSTGVTSAMTILADGDVGFGTTTPTASLSINAPAQTQPYFLIGSTTSTVLSVNPPTGIGGNWSFGSTTQDARFSIHANAFDTFNANIFDISSSSASATTSLLRVTNTGSIFAPNTSSVNGAQTGYWCYDANGQLIRDVAVCIAVSARRFKKDIQQNVPGLDETLKLNAVSYKLKPDYNTLFADNPNYNGTMYSLIADDVQKVDPKLVAVETATTTFEGTTYPPGTVAALAPYENWVGLFVQSFHDLNKKVNIYIGMLVIWNILITGYLIFKRT